MKIVIQRVKKASVSIEGKVKAEIKKGFLVLVGIGQEDREVQAREMAGQISELRVMEGKEGKMNLSLLDTGGEVLVVSQFTLYADTSRGRRPSFSGAADPAKAEKIYNNFVQELKNAGLEVQTGEFGAYMEVFLVNDGPVTLVLESG